MLVDVPEGALGAFVPTAHLGSGPDGSAVLARSARGELVELRILAGARLASSRWAELDASLRLQALLSSPSIRAVHDVHRADPPIVVLEPPGVETLAARIERGAMPPPEAALFIERVAYAVGAAHRLGLFHGALVPSLVHLDARGHPRLELTGVRTWDVASWGLVDHVCLAPEDGREPADSSADVYGLGAMLLCMCLGRAAASDDLTRATDLVPGELGALIAATLTHDRDLRPSAAEVVLTLRELLEAEQAPRRVVPHRELPTLEGPPDALARTVSPASAVVEGTRLGRFQILGRLGEGGMGEVFEGMDLSDGGSVAIKVLRPDTSRDATLLRRFRREARTLARVRSPYVANVLDINSDRGIHYIALELVRGPTVADYQDQLEGQRLPEREALEVAADVCRALADPHRYGVVHRDIKPENMMFVSPDRARSPAGPMVKLCDFGIARSADAIDRGATVQMTQEGVILGTPMFMAPEQCQARPVSPATDVYALGVTLYLLIAGRPPFDSDDPVQLLMQHVGRAPPPILAITPELGEATARIVERALAKDPKDRFIDAGEMLDAIERVLRGEPTDIEAHPLLPVEASARLREFRVEVELDASPEELWPYVCNSDRLNRAVGMPPPRFESQGLSEAPEDVLVTGTNRVAGNVLRWREAPFEWVEGRRWGSYREFDAGPFFWFIADTELTPRAEGGTRLVWRLRWLPRSWLMGLVVQLEMRFKQGPVLRRVFQRIDALLTGRLASAPGNDVFEAGPAKLGRSADARVQQVASELIAEGLDPDVVEHVASYVRHGADVEMARIRPLELAERFGLPPEATVAVFLHGTKHGLFELNWDILCPLCRVPSDHRDSLRAIEEHARCAACNVDYDLDFARSVELVFRVSPQVRASERRRYCFGGPFLFPHVAAQLRLKPGERFVLSLALEAGQHRVRSAQLANVLELRVSPSAKQHRLDLLLGEESPRAGDAAVLAPGEQHLVLTNTLERDMIVRVERMAPRADALTAARASSMAAFRELFPDQVLAPGQLVSLTRATFVRTEIDGASKLYTAMGDGKAFEIVMRHVRTMSDLARRHGGTVVKTVGPGVLAVFDSAEPAARVALAVHEDREVAVRVAAHQGPVMAATIDDKLDYFGRTIGALDVLLGHTTAGRSTFGAPLLEDPAVRAVLRTGADRSGTLAVPHDEPGTWALSVRPATAVSGDVALEPLEKRVCRLA